ncbi:MAG: WGR domain-containing protein [Hyphomicrobiaceae bacterium]
MFLTRPGKDGRPKRFYTLQLAPGLFGEWAIAKEWGELGREGKYEVEWFSSEADARQMIDHSVNGCRRRGFAIQALVGAA